MLMALIISKKKNLTFVEGLLHVTYAMLFMWIILFYCYINIEAILFLICR
jgi:hypothetical protein